MPAPKPASLLSGAKSPPHLITLVLLAGSSGAAMNIFLPVLPAIASDLSVTDGQSQYVLTLYLTAIAFVQLFIGPISDRYGRRPVLLTTSFLFVVSGIICALAPNFTWLIFGRLLMSVSAASMVLSRAIIRDLYDRTKSASMIGYVTMAMALIPMMAPSVGGIVGEAMGWQGPFYILIGVAVVVLLFVYFDLGETHAATKTTFSDQMQAYAALLREPMVWGYFMTASLASGAYFAFLGGAPFVGTMIVGISASKIGFYFACLGLGYIVGNFLTGRYSERIGIELMMILGGAIAGLGVVISMFLMLVIAPRAEFLFFPMVLVGLGNGMALPNAIAGAISVRPDLAGSASGLGGFLQIGGGALLAMLSGHLITVENQAMPLYVIMFLSSAAAALISLFMYLQSKRQSVTV